MRLSHTVVLTISFKRNIIQLHMFNFTDFTFIFEQFLEEEIAAQREGDTLSIWRNYERIIENNS